MTDAQPYDLQGLYAEKAGEPFRFTWADQVWELPSVRMLDIELQDRLESLDADGTTVDTLNTLFDELLGPEQGARWRTVPRPVGMITDLFAAWLGHSSAAMGESPASASSSRSTGRPSKRTSNGSTASGSRVPSSRKPRKSVTPPVSS